MRDETCDILISGGGIAGLCAAAAFGSAGFSVICVDPTPPVTDAADARADMRSTAMLQPARAVLQAAGIWDHLAPFAAPLQVMRIVDAGEEGDGKQHVIKDFDAADISNSPFGWNFPNTVLRREILARLAELSTVSFRPGLSTKSVLTRSETARVVLSDQTRITARLLVGADGRNSPTRAAAGIDVHTKFYGQKALAFCVTHPIPHNNVSTEIHRSGGPFTLVPLPDLDGLPCSAVVWMDDGPAAQARMELDQATFEAEASARAVHIYGPLTLASRRALWPIISQTASRMSAQRIALIAEAAHVVPPIGAQGLNMSLQDTKCLLDLATANPHRLGDRTMLEAYHSARIRDIRLRARGIDLLNRASQAQNPMLKQARAFGLEALYALGPVRKTLMQLGLGMRS